MYDFTESELIILKLMTEYYKDKLLAEKCGLKIQDICVHYPDDLIYLSNPPRHKCRKCGEFYT